ncbi:MAG: hypothetical protein K8R21_03305, partial [Leptospira sp.]|nr:hypothetical protein [Leptospira sp.]
MYDPNNLIAEERAKFFTSILMRSFLSIILLVSCLNCLSFSLTVIRGQNADKSTSRIPADTFMFILDSAIAYQLFLVGTAPVLGGVYAIGTIGLFIDRLYDNLTAEEKDSK